MTGVSIRAAALALLGCLVLAGCGSGSSEPVTAEPWVARDEPPAYCAPSEGGDEDFWAIVHATCAKAQDGDLAQAEALRQTLEDSTTAQVAAFHRSLVRANHALRGITEVADDLCAPGLGLGDDLSADYRSWVVAHGQSAYEEVLADPEVLRSFPDARYGCGLGEPFGAAALSVHLRRTGRPAKDSGLPLLERPS